MADITPDSKRHHARTRAGQHALPDGYVIGAMDPRFNKARLAPPAPPAPEPTPLLDPLPTPPAPEAKPE